ncbi:NlpC/P60 family protein [Methylobacterium mesophilicum]
MAEVTIVAIQTALTAKGFKLEADGVWGRKSIDAFKAFQAKNHLLVDGVIGPASLVALGLSRTAPMDPVWLSEARRKLGLNEKRDNAELKAFLKSDGKTLGDPAKLPWCGDFVQTCIDLTLPDEAVPTNPYWALNWLKFGRALKTPAIGAILVFSRDGGGHVGFYVGERKDAYRVLGGNQTNSIVEAWVFKAGWKGTRWPKTAPLPSGGRVMLTDKGTPLSSASMA